MCKKLDVASSELVLSAIFYLQQKNGVSEKEITKFISKKLGCKQSSVSDKVKEALDKAIENGIFTRKQGLYRIERSLGGDLKSIKKSLAKEKKQIEQYYAEEEEDDDEEEEEEEMHSSFKCNENPDDRWLNSQSSKSDRISLDQLDLLKSKANDDDDDEEDFLEDEDDELDFFDDDQFSQVSYIKVETPPPGKSKLCKNHRRPPKRKPSISKKRRRKTSRMNRRMKRKKLTCTCRNSNYAEKNPVKSNEKSNVEKAGGGPHIVTSKQNKRNNKLKESERVKNGRRGKKAKDSTAYCNQDYKRNPLQVAKKETKVEDPKVQRPQRVGSKDDQTKKNSKEEQLKRKGKEDKSNEEKESPKNGDEVNPKKDTKDQIPQATTKTTAKSNGVPPEREWRRKKAKRQRSSSLFRPIKKKVSSKEKQSLEQKSAKYKITK